MKRVLKKSLIIAVIAVLTLSAVLLCACNNDDNYRNPRNGEPEAGTFYDLQTVYDNGWISKGDLQNIAYYHNGYAHKKGFKPAPKNPETLSADIELAIRQNYFDSRCDNKAEFTVDNVHIEKYYGIYDDFVAMMITADFFAYALPVEEVIVGGVAFKYYNSNRITVWKK
ncbi:MAG: hypothetical protein K2M17_01085 [Bacilli bacterium]|nr:hypothetical protein [Bacilli bacterium]